MAANQNDPNVNININANNQTDQATQQVNSNLDSIAAAAGKVGIIGAVIGAGIVAIKELGGAIRGYADDAAGAERQANKLAEVLNKNSGGTQAQTDALIEQAGALLTLTGYSDDAIVAAQTVLAGFKLNAQQIAETTPLILDTAEAMRKMGQTDVDLEQVATSVAQAVNGKTKALEKLGVTLTPVQAETLKLGTQQERLKVINDALSASFGGLAEKMGDKFEASLRRLDESAGNLDETIGGTITSNEAAKNAVDAMSTAYDDFGKLIVANSGVIAEGINFTVASIVEGIAIIKGVINSAQLVIGGASLAITESFRLIAVGMSKVTFGDVAKKWQESADDLEGVSASLKEGLSKDFEELKDAAITSDDPLAALKKNTKQSAEEISSSAKKAIGDVNQLSEQQRVKQEEAYKQDKENRDTQIADIKAGEEEKIRLIKASGDSVKVQDEAIFAEKLANSEKISALLQNQLNDDRVALGAFNTEKLNFTKEELEAAKTSLEGIKKASDEHYKSLTTLAETYQGKVIQGQKAIEDMTKTSEEKIREIKRAGMSDVEVSADKELEIQQKIAQLQQILSDPNGNKEEAVAAGKKLQELAASQATAAASQAKATGDTYLADLALAKYNETVNLTIKAQAELNKQNQAAADKVNNAAGKEKAIGQTAAAQIGAINEYGNSPFKDAKLNIVADVAPITALKTALSEIPDKKIINVGFSVDGQPISYSDLKNPLNQNPAVAKTGTFENGKSQLAEPQKVDVGGKMEIVHTGLEGLEPLVKQWATDALFQQLKNERRSGQ